VSYLIAALALVVGGAAMHLAVAIGALREDGADGWLLAGPLLVEIAGALLLVWVFRSKLDVQLRTKGDALRDEEARRLSEQLERGARLETVGQLAGGVAHDFNNLLAVILNYASFVLGDLSPDDPRREDVAEIRRAAERARDLTHQLLVFSRREMALPEVVDVAEALAAAENLLRRTIGAHIELHTYVAPEVLRVTLGAGQLEQVLLNLAVNARDAMPDGGRLEIRAENGEGGRTVRLTVRDDGVGMPADTAEHAFDPFFTTKPSGKGTGLGLATIYGIVTRASGTVALRSRPGAGTTVTIELPGTEATPRSAEPTPVPGSGAGRCVLVVEDEEAVRALTARTLREQGYEVMEARDGAEGLERCRQAGASLDLLLTDVVMPGLSGIDLGARARELNPGLPIVYVSGYTGDLLPSGTRMEESGDVLAKPFDREALLRAVEDALAERRAAV
jgi:two-component system, cell cycle sensor histidine kinase and response regulator CckA